jgi:hypothetical protein
MRSSKRRLPLQREVAAVPGKKRTETKAHQKADGAPKSTINGSQDRVESPRPHHAMRASQAAIYPLGNCATLLSIINCSSPGPEKHPPHGACLRSTFGDRGSRPGGVWVYFLSHKSPQSDGGNSHQFVGEKHPMAGSFFEPAGRNSPWREKFSLNQRGYCRI